MKAFQSLRRLIAALLCAALPGSGWAVQVAPHAGRVMAGPNAGAAAGTVSVELLRSMDLHLGRLLPSEGSTLPAVSLIGNAALPSPAEYLAREALGSARPGVVPVERALAARLIAAASSDPAAAAKAAAALRADYGALGRGVADKLEAFGRKAGSDPSLKQLGKDLIVGNGGRAVREKLAAFFDGGSGIEGGPVPADAPEDFASYAERRFQAGRLLPGEHAGVIASKGRSRTQDVPGDGELYDRVELSPLTNPERERVVVELFEKAGASREEIVLQDAGRGRHNIIVVKKGRSDRVVVVGGHHDKVSRGNGTIDNWTGATMVVNLYQALRDADTEATFVFVAFAREEEGLLGSKEYLRSLSREQRAKIDSMVNLDTLAVDGTFSWENNSDQELLDAVRRTAGETGYALEQVRFWGGDADSSSFRRYRIPAMTLFGASPDVIFDIIHSANDTIARFSLPHYKNAYLLTLALLKLLDSNPVKPGFLARLAARIVSWFRSPAAGGIARPLSFGPLH